MKKYLIWIGAAVLVMALASPSMAQFKTWGHLEIESYWLSNKSFNSNNYDANYQGVGSRYRFNLGYGDPKTVMAVLGFEANSRAYGEGPADAGVMVSASSGYPGGSGGSSGPAVAGNGSYVSMAGKIGMGDWGTDSISLQVRHAYLDFTIPNTPLTMQVGLQNVVIGGFLGRFFMNKDVPAVFLNAQLAPHTISAFWWKGMKQNFYMDNDLDYYGLLYRLKNPVYNVEAWFVYGNDRRSINDTWVLTQLTSTGAVATPATQYPTSTTAYQYYLVESISPRGYEQKPWWLGANVPITLGNVRVEPTLIHLGGRYYDAINTSIVNYYPSALDAWLGDVIVSYRLGPGLTFLGEGFYTTGRTNNPNTGGAATQFFFPGLANGVATSVAGNENRNVFANGFSVFFFWNTELSYYNAHQLDPGGLAYVRGNVEYNPFAWLNLNVNYFPIWNTASNGYVSHIVGATNANATYVGAELNLIAKIAIYKDFLYAIGFGYFFAGPVFDTPGTATAGYHSAENAWSLLTNLKYVF